MSLKQRIERLNRFTIEHRVIYSDIFLDIERALLYITLLEEQCDSIGLQKAQHIANLSEPKT